MSARIGLAAETCTRELAQAMAAIPVLAEAFSKSSLMFRRIGQPWPGQCESPFYLEDRYWSLMERVCLSETGGESISAPTVRSMLVWLLSQPQTTAMFLNSDDSADPPLHHFIVFIKDENDFGEFDITDPDALARAVIEASK